MDGVLLVLDSRNLPNLHALATIPAVTGKAQPKRNRAVPAFATLILALVLGMVYYVSIHRRAAQNTYTAPAAASATESAPVVNPTPEPQPSQDVQTPAPEEAKLETTRPPATTAPARKQPAKALSTKTESEPKKEDSKVGSILKKTGRILKKPFKF
jgi:cytoskeletal protein RodZ